MSSRLARSWPLVLAYAVLLPLPRVVGQQTQIATRGPRFLMAAWPTYLEQDASSVPVLRRRVSLDLTSVTVDEALKEITRQAELEISYSPRVVPVDRSVSVHARDITVAAALTEILLETGVDISVTARGELALIRRVQLAHTPAPVDSGTVVGRVTDAGSGSPLVGATVSVDGTRLSAAAGVDGRYRIARVAVGTHTLRARFIGYTPASTLIEVSVGQEATADFALQRSAQELNQVVVTGTIVPTEVKALPTPVSVITSKEIARQGPTTVHELFRHAVPSAVSWDAPHSPANTAFSVRGASTFLGGTSQMKVFVDGVEVANATQNEVDVSSIDRIEVIRGPQAAAVYGSGAIGGVVQIFTKRGDAKLSRPQVDAQASLGAIQTPYAGYRAVLRQNYGASVHGGGSDMSYNFGTGYSRTADYLPGGQTSRISNPSVYGGMRFTRGIASVDLSGRFFTVRSPIVNNPAVMQTGFVAFSKPFYEEAELQTLTVGARLSAAPMPWWQHTVTVGYDRFTDDDAQTQPRLTSPADTLLLVFLWSQAKTSVGYNTTLHGPLASGVTASLTAGVDYWRLPVTQFFTPSALNTRGTIGIAPNGFSSQTRDITTNSGYFAQAQLGFHDALFLTGGLRAEENSDFGDSLGTPVSPRVGISYVQQVKGATLKVRSSYGRAVRAPSPGLKVALVSGGSAILANPGLGPERQQGWDAGVDAAFGSHGTLSITYYDQTATNLIQQVLLGSEPVPTSQYQNVGRVKNTGVELEGTLRVGLVQFRGQYGYTRSRIEQLSASYNGDLRVGDQSLLTPRHSAGGSLTVAAPAGTTVVAGFTYLGSWNNYDLLARLKCFGHAGPCPTSTRGYIVSYPGFIKVNATVSQQITPLTSGFISIDNLTNNEAFEIGNASPVTGRVTTIGLRFNY